jgi:hypothetical protein
MKAQELEAGNKDADVLGFNVRERDEGDLFGVRAIEAGYYGGVIQSQPASLAGSPAVSRSGSPAMGYYHGTFPFQCISLITSRHRESDFPTHQDPRSSVTSSTMNQFPRSGGNIPEVAQPTRGVSFQNAPNIEVHHPRSGQSHQAASALLPSAAELSNRLTHHSRSTASVDTLPAWSSPLESSSATHFHSYSTDALPHSPYQQYQQQLPLVTVTEPETRFSQASSPYYSPSVRASAPNATALGSSWGIAETSILHRSRLSESSTPPAAESTRNDVDSNRDLWHTDE